MDLGNHIAAEELGLKPIHLACLEGDFEAVVALAAEDGVMDALTEPQTGADWRLRETPIKLAALMGHRSIVEFFIERGALLVHDSVRNDTHASLYAREDGLAEQRRDFYLRTIQTGREDLDAVNARKTIYELLSSPGRRGVLKAVRGPRADLGYADYKLGKQGRHIIVYAPVYRIKTDISLQRKKTIGVITTKGQGDVLMAAHSGFRLGGDHDEKCLNTNQWNYIALHHIAAVIDFKFPGNLHDNGARPVEDDAHRGRAHAGHVEVLLASWYALEMTRRVTGRRDAPLAWLLARMRRVKKAATLGDARCAVVLIDHQPCLTCLKFINRLYQHTGVYFAVQGSVGVGPTLATKDPRNHLRLDTFGDVFPASDDEVDMDDGDDDDEIGDDDDADDDDDELDEDVEEVVPETPAMAAARNSNNARAHAQGPRDNHLPAPAPRAFPWMADPRHHRLTPEPADYNDMAADDDVGYAARVVMERIAGRAADPLPSTTTTTPARPPPMAWPIPGVLFGAGTGTGSRHPRTPRRGEDPFGDMPSRRPENHRELLADYKKKTPVWQWPGYEAVAQMRSEDLRRRLAAAAAATAATPCPPGGQEDIDIDDVDGEDENPEVGEQGMMRMGMGMGTGMMMEIGGAGAGSEEDMVIVDPHDDDSDDAAAYSPGNGANSSAHPALSGNIDERISTERDEGSSSPISPLAHHRVFLYSSFAPIPPPPPHPHPPRARISERAPNSMLQAAEMVLGSDLRMQVDDDAANNNNNNNNEGADEDDDFYMIGPSSQRARLGDESMEEVDEVEMVSAHFPPARPISFSQWKYQPPARPGTANGRGNAPEAPMFQPRPIPNFRGLHRLGRP
ncbi:low-affinity Zn(2+) transporter zrt2 [Hypoxylon texense]